MITYKKMLINNYKKLNYMKSIKKNIPSFRNFLKMDVLFPSKEANLPLVLLARPHGYVVLGRLLGVLLNYIRILLITIITIKRERKKLSN